MTEPSPFPNLCAYMPAMVSINPLRYAIVDNRRMFKKPHYWRGDCNGKYKGRKRWTTIKNKAMLWDCPQAVMLGIQEVMYAEYSQHTMTEFVLPLYVTMLAPAGAAITTQQLKAFVNKALVIMFDYPEVGMGPVPGSVVMVECDTDHLHERKPLNLVEVG